MASVPHMKRATWGAEVYARSEVEAILTAPRQPGSRPMTPLRAKYIRDLVIRGRSKNTEEASLAIRGYQRGTITALNLLAPVQSCFSKLLAAGTLRIDTHTKRHARLPARWRGRRMRGECEDKN
jgi:hypothetical protein